MRVAALTLVASLALVPQHLTAQSHSGALEAGDETRSGSGQYADSYEFEVAEGQQIIVTMSSMMFDTYLIVMSPSGNPTENDDAGSTNESRVEMVATEAGTWTAMATSYSQGETGAYQLEIQLGSIASVETVEGRLDPQDDVSIKGEYYDTHTITVTPGSEFQIELSSLGFDGYLTVMTPSGVTHRNDDAGSFTISRIGPLTGEAGDYTVYVTSASAGEVGAYDLRILTFGEESGGGANPEG